MCGITGGLSFNDTAADPRPAMRVMAHRGPDDRGIWVCPHPRVSLGHCRLAVIDPSHRSHQPMTGGDYILAYNGEVYNFRELREELRKLGHQFGSTGDTEVVFTALREWGVDALPKFNGMFALAWWDKEKKELLLARDRYGIKPLYFTWHGGVFVFASEIKALLAYGVKAELDPEGLDEYLTHGHYLAGTLFKHISMLAPGSWLKIRGDTLTPHQYWTWEFNEQSMDYEEARDEVGRLFEQAVRRQLVSDVPVNTYLSGGLDTGGITAIASQETEMCSFTVGYGEGDEREAAERMSRRFGTEHYEAVIKPQDIGRSLRDIVWHLEEPRAGQCYPNWFAAKLASKFGKVVLSGVGGDELFGGYPWRDMTSEQTASFLHNLLVVEDKLSMAHSLEARVPLLDNDLVDFALTLPKDFKVKGGHGKLIFRDAMRGTLPDKVVFAPKQGFTAPDETWFRHELRPYIEHKLLGRDARIFDYIDRAETHKLVAAHLAGRNERKMIWSLLYLEEWLEVFCR